MEIIRMKTNMLSQKIIANVSAEFAKAYHLPEGHQSVAFFSVMMRPIWLWTMPRKRLIYR